MPRGALARRSRVAPRRKLLKNLGQCYPGPMTWASIFATVAILALAAGCADRAAIPPCAPPEVALPPLAEAGDADAQVSLGYMYQTGQSFEQSYSLAARWYRPAAEQGNALAQFALGELYARGLGLELDYGAAAYWFGRAAMNGNVSAQIRLANFDEKGLGVAQDYGEAARWYGRASRASRGLNAPPPAIERLENSPIEKIFLSNTIPVPSDKMSSKIHILSVSPVLGDAIRRIHNKQSVSSLFI